MSFVLTLVEMLSGVPSFITVAILAMLPVSELRGALPVALTVFDMPVGSAFFWSVLGNMLPVYFLLVFFERTANWLQRKSPAADKIISKLYERTRVKLESKVEKYGPWALAIFVAIPLPATGAWSGALAAYVFGLPKKTAFVAILAGVISSAIIVSLLTLGAVATASAIGG